MKTCEDCGTRLNERGQCLNCDEELIIFEDEGWIEDCSNEFKEKINQSKEKIEARKEI